MWFLRLLGFVNALPNTVLSAFVVVPLLVGKNLKPGDFSKWKPKAKDQTPWCVFLEVTPGSWLDNHAWWAGATLGAFVLIKDKAKWEDRGLIDEIIRHESCHVLQQYVGGIFMPVAYFVIAVVMHATMPEFHPYYNHPFEIMARMYAGDDDIIITKEQWMDWNERHGRDALDRWPWW